MKNSKTKNSLRNFTVSAASYVVTILCSFIVRTVFIRALSNAYLDINGLFTNILSILSLTEMGFANAIVYKLYKPLTQGDWHRVSQLMVFFRRVYRIIAVVVLAVGLLFIPFFDVFIQHPPDIPENLLVIYLLYLSSNVLSYLFVYKKTLLIANQDNYLADLVTVGYTVVLAAAQIALLLFTHNFILYLAAQVLCTLIMNYANAFICDRKFSALSQPPDPLPAEEKKGIFRDVRALIIYRFSSIIVNGTDNLILSARVSLGMVGLYSNYYLITHALYSLIRQSLVTISSSIGHLNAGEDEVKKERVFRTINLLSTWMFGVCGVCLYVLLEPFITLWIGSDYLFSDVRIVGILAINFFLQGVTGINNVLRGTFGLFVQGQFRPLLSSIINLVFSLLLAGPLGAFGVFLGTAVSYVAIGFWYDPLLIYRTVFVKPSSPFFAKTALRVGALLACAWICPKIMALIPLGGFIGWLMRGVTVFTLANGIFLLVNAWTDEFAYMIKLVRNVLHQRLRAS